MTDLEKLAQIAESNTMNLATMSNQLRLNNKAISMMSDRQDAIEARQNAQDARMDRWELSERVSRSQDKALQSAIQRRVSALIGIEYVDGHVAEEFIEDDKRYRGGFISRCYFDAREKSKLGSPRSETKKGDFDEVMEYIEMWRPEGGVEEYKDYLDKRKSCVGRCKNYRKI